MTNMSNFCGNGDITKIYVVEPPIPGSDNYVTGGTYTNGTLILERQNGIVIVTGFTSTDTFVTGFTYDNTNNLIISRNQGQPDLIVNISVMTGLTVDGILSATTYYGNSLGTVGNCFTNLFVSNINSCSPLHIQNISIGDVLIGENGGINVGIGTSAPTEKLEVSGKTKTIELQVTSGATVGYVLTALDIDGNAYWAPNVAIDSFVTGFSYNNANIITLGQNQGIPDFNVDISTLASISVNGDVTTTGITTTNNLIVNSETTLSGLTNYYNIISGTNPNEIINLNYLTGYVQTTDVYVTGSTLTPADINFNTQISTLEYHGIPLGGPYTINTENTFTTGGTYDNNTAFITFKRNDGQEYLVDLSTIDVNDTYVTGGTYNEGVYVFTNNSGGTFNVSATTTYSAGVISGGIWSSTGTGEINLPEVKVALFNNSENLEPIFVYTIPSGTTGSGGIPTLQNNDTNYVIIDYNGGSPIYNVINNDVPINNSNIVLYLIVYRADNFIHVLEFGNQGAGLPNKLNDRIIKTQRFARESGFALDLSGSTGIVTLSAGVAWNATLREPLLAVNSQDDIFFQNFHSGGTWVYTTTATTLNNLYYDDGTNPVLVAPNKYLVNWYFRGQELNDHLYEVWGNNQYDSVSLAQLSTEPILPELVTSHAFLVGRIIVQSSATTGSVESAFVTVFGGSQVQAHNDLFGIQGGSPGEYFHLNFNQYSNLALLNLNNVFLSGITANTISTVNGININGLGTYNTNVNGANPSEIVNVNYLTGYVQTNDVYVTGATYTEATNSSDYTQWQLLYHSTPIGNPPYIFSGENTFTTGGTYDNSTAKITFDKNDGTKYEVDLSTIDVNDTYVTGGTNNSATFDSPNATIDLLYNQDVSPNIYFLPYTDVFVTGFTNGNNTFIIYDNSGNTFSTTLNTLTGLTINGDLFVSGNFNITGNTNQIGSQYITGNTEQIGNIDLVGDFNITGNTEQIGDVSQIGNVYLTGDTEQIGNYFITGDTEQIGNVYLTGNTEQIGDFNITGNTSQIGNTFQNGNFNIIGDTNQIGNFNITGNTEQLGDIDLVGNFNITGNTNQIGDFNITGNTGQIGDTVQFGNFYLSGNSDCTLTIDGNICLDGNLNITGNTNQIGDVSQIGNYFITGNTEQIGDTIQIGNVYLTGNTEQLGDFDLIGNFNITGNTEQIGDVNQIGNVYLTGNTNQIGDVSQIGNYFITGNTEQIGDIDLIGNLNITGNTNQIGSFYLSGNSDCTLTIDGNICLDGNFNITGNTNQLGNFNLTGNTNQIGNFTISGNTFQNGNFTITGNTNQLGNTSQIGNFNITGNTNQIGNFNITGNTTQSGSTFQLGNFNITGNTNQLGNTFQLGNFNITGNTNQLGNFTISGNTFQNRNFTITGNTTQSGNTTQVGNYNVTGNTNQLGYNYIVSATTGCTLAVTGTTCLTGPLNIVGPTFMSGNFCMNNMNSGGVPTGTNCLDTTLIPSGTSVLHQFQGESGVLAHIGDLASGEPNSKGYIFMENNVVTTVLPNNSTAYTRMSGTTQPIAAYLNLFTTGTSSNELVYNYPPSSGTNFTYLKYNVSYTARANQNGKQVTFALIRSPFPYTATTVVPAAMTNYMQGSNQDVTGSLTGIVAGNDKDKFFLALSNSAAGNTFGVTVSDVTISLFT